MAFSVGVGAFANVGVDTKHTYGYIHARYGAVCAVVTLRAHVYVVLGCAKYLA